MKNIDDTRNYFVEDIDQNELMSEKHKKYCMTLNYIEHFLILGSRVTGCIIFAFGSLLAIYRNYKIGNGIKNLYNNCRNYTV